MGAPPGQPSSPRASATPAIIALLWMSDRRVSDDPGACRVDSGWTATVVAGRRCPREAGTTRRMDPTDSLDGLPSPVGAWDLIADGRDTSGQGQHARVIGDVRFAASVDPMVRRPVLQLHGAGRLEVVPTGLGREGFTVAAWVNAGAPATTVLGDAVAWFDTGTRHGFTLGYEHGSPCGSHGNDRTVWFGVDSGSEPMRTDHGRPGDATVMVCSMAVFDGSLHAATWEGGSSPRGRVFRLGADGWEDLGSPWDANAVTRLAVHDGTLYAGVSRLRGGGSGTRGLGEPGARRSHPALRGRPVLDRHGCPGRGRLHHRARAVRRGAVCGADVFRGRVPDGGSRVMAVVRLAGQEAARARGPRRGALRRRQRPRSRGERDRHDDGGGRGPCAGGLRGRWGVPVRRCRALDRSRPPARHHPGVFHRDLPTATAHRHMALGPGVPGGGPRRRWRRHVGVDRSSRARRPRS